MNKQMVNEETRINKVYMNKLIFKNMTSIIVFQKAWDKLIYQDTSLLLGSIYNLTVLAILSCHFFSTIEL